MSTSDDRPGRDDPTPPAWDAPPQPPAWDAPGPQPAYGQQPGQEQWYGQQPPQGGPPPQQGWGAPPQQGWGPPPGYGGYPPQGFGGYGAPQTETKGVVALVLAIASFFVCPLVPAVIALVLASGSQRDIEASGGRLTGLGVVKAAKIISWINIALWVLAVAAFVLFVVVAGSTTAEFSTTTY